MAIVVKDRVQQTSTTTGTSDFVLSGSVSGFQSFAAIGDTNTTYYAAVDPNTGDWEVGTGTYSTTGPTLTRTTILESSNAGAKVVFAAGAKNVFCTYPAEKAIYEEEAGNVLIDGGPITVVGDGVTGFTTFSAALGELYGNVNSFAQFYAQNYNDGAEASADFVAYRDDALDDTGKFVDMGVNSSNYSSATYPIFSPGSAYTFNDGGEMFFGSATDDVVLFAGGVAIADEAVRIDKTTKDVTLASGLNVGAALDVTGAAEFGSTVLLDADPTLALQAATKQYVDQAAASGFTVHPAVRLATSAALPINIYNNGVAGVGATLTAVANGALSIDGVAVATSNRVLVQNEVFSANNGAYSVTATGSVGTPYILTRTTDFDQAAAGEIANNAYFFVSEGATHAGSSFILSQLAAITVGTTALPFTQFSDQLSYMGGTNIDVTGLTISLTGTVAATNGGTGTNTVATGDLLYGSGTNTWSKLPLGTGYKSLVVNAAGTQLEWNAVALNQAGAVSGALGATNGGTGQNAYAVGDILYSGATNTLAKLAGNTTTTKKFLIQTGTGSGSAAPTWDTVSSGDVGGLGTMATQNANSVAITGGTVSGVAISGASTINASVIGGTIPAAITGTTISGTTVTGTTALVADNGLVVNKATIGTSYTLAAGYNAISAGPVTVNSGVVVTVSAGSRWVVV